MTIEQDNITPTTLPREDAPGQPARPIFTSSGAGHVLGRAVLAGAAGLFVAFLTLPIVALLLRVPIGDLATYAARPIVRDALLLSLGTTLVSLGLMLALGTPLAYLMARRGCRVDFIHFTASSPQEEEGSKVWRLAQQLTRYTMDTRLFVVPYVHFDLALMREGVQYEVVLFRRFMVQC